MTHRSVMKQTRLLSLEGQSSGISSSPGLTDQSKLTVDRITEWLNSMPAFVD